VSAALPVELAYAAEDRRQRVLHSKIGAGLALVLMPAGVLLDLFVYPEMVWPLLASRLICDVLVLGVLMLLFTEFGKRHINLLGITWALLPGATMSWMIYATEGAASPYYAGLNLVIIGVALLMPWTMVEVAITCALTLLFYLLATLGHAGSFDTLMDSSSELFNNVFFIVLTAVVCTTASIILSRMRRDDYELRHDLAARNEEINESYKQLAELDRMKSRFFANVSHELRTPLTLILAPIEELLRSDQLPDDVRGTLSMVRENGLRLLRLINDLLDFARFEAKGAELKPRVLDLAEYVPGVIHSAGHLAEAKNLELSVNCNAGVVPAHVDADAFEKVLLNLFTNAVKFTAKGGRIDVTLRKEGGDAVIEIKDSGIGIARDDLPRIFERFAQVDGSSTRMYSGVGIGLALSRELVEAHNGSLLADSQPQHGTSMLVRLPLAETEALSTDKDEDTEVEEDHISGLHRSARRTLPSTGPVEVEVPQENIDIVLVEDEPEMRRFIRGLLGSQHKLAAAPDGLAGVEMVKRTKPKLAIVDYMLPKLNGLEVVEALRAESGLESLKILMLTARSEDDLKINVLERGANDFLTKPFSSLELRTRVVNMLRSAGLEEDIRRTNDELRRTVKTLRETEEQLIRSEKLNALGTLAAGILHEINNPLNFTLTAADMAVLELEGESPDLPDLRDTLADITQGMKRIRDVVTDLRSFAYPEKQPFHQPINLKDAIDSSIRITAHELRGIKIVVDVPSGLEVRAAENQVVQVLINLLTNAARAIAKVKDGREPSIDIRARLEGRRVEVRVRDNGIGMDADALQRACDPFYTSSEPGQGMGMGLSICQTLLRNHDSSLKLESKQGQWTEAIFELPTAGQET
jgi:signal transduction histidine kinase